MEASNVRTHGKETHPGTNYALCRYAGRDGHRATTAHHATASLGASRGDGRRRDWQRTGHPKLHSLASPRQVKERGLGEGAARWDVSLVHREHGVAGRAARFPVRRVLYAQPGSPTRKVHYAL